MRKTFLALVCLFAILFSIALPAVSGADYSGIYCVAVNDKVLLNLLTAETMPFYRDGVLYVPYTVFNGTMTDVPFDINDSYNRESDTFALFTRQKTLVFYISGGYSLDTAGTRYQDRVISRNGRIFVPVRFVCSFFGLNYSYLVAETSGGSVPIVRITNDLRDLTDEQFLPPAVEVVAGRVADYHRSLNPSPSPSQPSPPPPTTTAPPPPPPTTTDQPTDKRDVRVYFAFEAEGALDGLDKLLSTLATERLTALFLFPPERLAELDDAVRRVLGHGHRIGFLLGGESAEEFAEGSRLMTHIARAETRLVSLPQGASADPDWIVWRGNAGGGSGTAAVRSNRILGAAAAQRTEARITLDCTAQGADTLERVLRGLTEDNYDLRSVTEPSLL